MGSRYISGSFCVSITAAIGMPKLETGPQKSGREGGGLLVVCDWKCFGVPIGVCLTYGLSRHSSRLAANGSWH